MIELRPIGRSMRFEDIMIGHPFALYDTIWIKIALDAASELVYTGYKASRVIGAETEREAGWDGLVEVVNVVENDNIDASASVRTLRAEYYERLPLLKKDDSQ